MASSNHTVVVSVLGLSRLDGENFSSHQGIGKSCLCYRFMYPGYDDYQQDHRSHSSLLALHEFESDVIHKDPFLYWGSTTRTYDAKGSSEKVQFEVLEYPVFYEDITDQPFHSKKSIGSLDGYMRMVLARTLDSPGKMSYKNRDLICSPQDYESVAFPPEIGKHRRGYVVVIDVSDNGPTFESRLRLTEKMVAHLASRKQKFICAATKTDESLATSLEKLSELARRNKFTLIEVSAKTNVNVTEMFEIVAAKVLGKTVLGLQTHVPPYSDAAQKTISIRNSARQAFRTYLQKRVTVASELLTAIERTEEYKACAHLHGKFETDKMFAQHVLTLRNDEVSTSANVMDKVNIRQQFLEAYVAERTDLSPYTKYLKDLIMKICQMCSNKVPILPSPPHTSLELNASTTDLTTIPNLPDHQQNTAGKKSNWDISSDYGKATQKLDKKDSMDPAADTVIGDDYTITKMMMERNGNLTVLPPVKFQNPQEIYRTLIPNIPSEKTSLPPDATIQTTEIHDFINSDVVTQEVDEEDGIYSVIETDLHPHVSNEDGESTLEGQDDDDNYSYVDVCKSHYEGYEEHDIVGSDSDEYVPITEIEMIDEDEHEYINTSEMPGLATEIVAVSQSQQPDVQFDSRPLQLDLSSAQLLQPLAQLLPAQEKEEQGQLVLTQGNTHPTSMVTSGESVADSAATALSRLREKVGNVTPPSLQPTKAPTPSVKIKLPPPRNSFLLIQPSPSTIETTATDSGRSSNGNSDSGAVTKPSAGSVTTAKQTVEKDDTLKATFQPETSKEIPVLANAATAMFQVTMLIAETNAVDLKVEKPLLAKIRKKLGKELSTAKHQPPLTALLPSFTPPKPDYQLPLSPAITSSKMLSQMDEDIWEHDYTSVLNTFPLKNKSLLLKTVEVGSSLSASPCYGQVIPAGETHASTSLDRCMGIATQSNNRIAPCENCDAKRVPPLPPLKVKPLFPKRVSSLHKPDLNYAAPLTTDSERSANGAIDPEVVTMPGDDGAAARIAIVKDDNLKSAMEMGTSKELTVQNLMSSVTIPMTENNAEKPTLAKIRKKLGKEKEKAKNDFSFIAPLPSLNTDHLLTLNPTMTSSKMSPHMNEWESNYTYTQVPGTVPLKNKSLPPRSVTQDCGSVSPSPHHSPVITASAIHTIPCVDSYMNIDSQGDEVIAPCKNSCIKLSAEEGGHACHVQITQPLCEGPVSVQSETKIPVDM